MIPLVPLRISLGSSGRQLAGAFRRLASPAGSEFAADYFVREPYVYRDKSDPRCIRSPNAHSALDEEHSYVN